ANDHELRVGHSQRHDVGHNYTITVGTSVTQDLHISSDSGQPTAGNSSDGGQPGGANSPAAGGDGAPGPHAAGSPGNSDVAPDDFNPFSFRSLAPQEVGIGTFQVTAPNLMTIAKLLDNKAVGGLEFLAVAGMNLEFNLGMKLESHVSHVQVSED